MPSASFPTTARRVAFGHAPGAPGLMHELIDPAASKPDALPRSRVGFRAAAMAQLRFESDWSEIDKCSLVSVRIQILQAIAVSPYKDPDKDPEETSFSNIFMAAQLETRISYSYLGQRFPRRRWSGGLLPYAHIVNLHFRGHGIACALVVTSVVEYHVMLCRQSGLD